MLVLASLNTVLSAYGCGVCNLGFVCVCMCVRACVCVRAWVGGCVRACVFSFRPDCLPARDLCPPANLMKVPAIYVIHSVRQRSSVLCTYPESH